ncbi:MAG: hypothetical protein H6660_13640 [Ardenticatenaceae bacterium]|nr:hypothetical protein [Ardenticatenaceae bacterium]
MRIRFFVLPLLVIVLGACAEGDGTAAVVTSQPQSVAVITETAVPTLTIPSATHTPLPTTTINPVVFEETAVPFATEERLRILEPAFQAEVTAGEMATFAGTVTPVLSTTLTLRLAVAYDTIYTATVPFDAQSGAWSLTTELPPVAGPAELQLSGASDSATVEFTIVPPMNMPGPLVTLDQPVVGETAVAGYVLFLSGEARDLLDDRLYMAVLADNCRTTAAAFSIELTTGIWKGELVLPANTPPGPACVVAYTGTRGQGMWLETRAPITILAADDPRAAFIRLGNNNDLTFQAGAATEIYGVAANAPDNEVQVTLLLDESGGGEVLETGTADVNVYGYWQIVLAPSAERTGPAMLTISMGDGIDYVELQQETAVLP